MEGQVLQIEAVRSAKKRSIRSKSSNRSNRFERLKRFERLELHVLGVSPLHRESVVVLPLTANNAG